MAVAVAKTFTVPAGQTASNTGDLGIVDGAAEIVGLIVVGAIISTTVTFKVSDDGVLFQTLNTQAGSAVSVTVASNTNVGLNQDTRAQVGRWRYIQIIAGSTETLGATFRFLVK